MQIESSDPVIPVGMTPEEAIQAVANDQHQVHLQVDALANEMAQLHHAHQLELQSLRQELLAAKALAAQAPPAPSSPLPSSQSRLKAKDPETFTGEPGKSNVRHFVTACRMRLASPSYRLESEFDKMLWVSSLLGEAASLWQQSKTDFHRGGTDFGFKSADEMLTELESAFQVGDEQYEATQKLDRLRQDTEAATQRIADFNLITAPLKMTEESEILVLRHSTDEEIKDALAQSLESTKSDFDLFCRHVIPKEKLRQIVVDALSCIFTRPRGPNQLQSLRGLVKNSEWKAFCSQFLAYIKSQHAQKFEYFCASSLLVMSFGEPWPECDEALSRAIEG